MRFGLLLVGWLWSAAAGAGEAAAWIERMNGAMHELSYRGVVVYVRGGQLQALEVERRFEAGAPVDVLRTLTGEPRQVTRSGDRVASRAGTAERTVDDALDEPWSLLVAGPVADLESIYRLTVTGEARVAGRAAAVVDAIPRDDARYGYRLWLDRESGLLLGSAVLTAAGQLLEQSMFTQVELGDRTVPTGTARPRTAGTEPRPSGWSIPGMPPGFRLMADRLSAGGGRHLVYSDGLASASVYIEPGPPRLVGHAQRALTRAYGVAGDGFHVVAVGELPPAALESIARSVRRSD
jgi:sigma-E factor negative regulatory protein RseB